MAPSTPKTAPNVTPILSRLEDDNTRKRKAIAMPPRPTPPCTGDSCLRHSGGYIVVLLYRVSCIVVGHFLSFGFLSALISIWMTARDVKRPSYVHHWAVAVGYVLLGSFLSSSAIKRGSAALSM
eukprot:scaffold22239_cov25-Attheya_sp.AAC.2